jgi:hypothetical protein
LPVAEVDKIVSVTGDSVRENANISAANPEGQHKHGADGPGKEWKVRDDSGGREVSGPPESIARCSVGTLCRGISEGASVTQSFLGRIELMLFHYEIS